MHHASCIMHHGSSQHRISAAARRRRGESARTWQLDVVTFDRHDLAPRASLANLLHSLLCPFLSVPSCPLSSLRAEDDDPSVGWCTA